MINDIKIIKATEDQRPILANLLELYAYDFTEFFDFDIGDNGFYGYEKLPLFWIDPNRYPYLIYVKDKIAGLVMVQKGSPISDDHDIWDIAEFFIMKKYKRQGIGTAVAHQIWNRFTGKWQVRVLVENKIATNFWLNAVTSFTGLPPKTTIRQIKNDDWTIIQFESGVNK